MQLSGEGLSSGQDWRHQKTRTPSKWTYTESRVWWDNHFQSCILQLQTDRRIHRIASCQTWRIRTFQLIYASWCNKRELKRSVHLIPQWKNNGQWRHGLWRKIIPTYLLLLSPDDGVYLYTIFSSITESLGYGAVNPATSWFEHPTLIRTGSRSPDIVNAAMTKRAHWREVNLNRRTTQADIRLLKMFIGITLPVSGFGSNTNTLEFRLDGTKINGENEAFC